VGVVNIFDFYRELLEMIFFWQSGVIDLILRGNI
jgi:hypothetical protein